MFCSNPEDFGIEGMDKDPIFDSLKSIAKLPSSPPENDDRLDDSAVQTVGSRTTGEGKIQEENLGEKPPVDSVGKCCPIIIELFSAKLC